MTPLVDRTVAALLASHDGPVSIDAIGEALGAASVSQAEIEAIFVGLEAAGRTVVAPAGGHGVAHLRRVLPAARALRGRGVSPTVESIAAETGLPASDVRAALLLAKVMSRG